MRIVFLHPFLGLGGAERLVVDAAVEFQERGHEVEICTLHHDPEHAFPETTDGTLRVRVHPTWATRSPLASPRALRAIAGMRSMAHAVARLRAQPDIYFCDLIPHAIPVLRRQSPARVVFYCHFPDKLLAPPAGDPFYRAYRNGLERLEETGLQAASRVLVNSRFTASKVREAFPRLADIKPEVVYPGVAVEPAPLRASTDRPISRRHGLTEPSSFTLLSINRFDPPKNLRLAVEMLASLRDCLDPTSFRSVRLVMAGALDERLPEQVRTLRELHQLAQARAVKDRIDFRVSISDAERSRLLSKASCFVYTPSFEHFGIGPIEAMLSGIPVVGVNSGGVRETVQDGQTGILCEATPESFARAVARLLHDPERAVEMGRAGRRRVIEHFSRQHFGDQLDAIVRSL